MSILIKDMNMPSECEFCPLCKYYPESETVWCDKSWRILKLGVKSVNYIHFNIKRPDWCQLVEISKNENSEWIPCIKDTKFDEFKECWVTMSDGKVKKLYYNPEYMPYPWITEFGSFVFGNKDILAYIPIEKPEPYQLKK